MDYFEYREKIKKLAERKKLSLEKTADIIQKALVSDCFILSTDQQKIYDALESIKRNV